MNDLDHRPKWPPAWNPFEVFLLSLALLSSAGLIQGSSGSTALDDRLDPLTVILWGIALALGSALALVGVFCYRKETSLVIGMHLERVGSALVGVAAAIYAFVIVVNAGDVGGVRYAAFIQIGFAAAAFFRAWQGHRALRRTYRIYRRFHDGR